MADGRRDNGAESLLTPNRQAELYHALQAEPPDGGPRTGPKVVRYVRTAIEITLAGLSTTHAKAMESLMTLRFQTFEDVSLLAA